MAVKSQDEQAAIRGDVKTHPLVHHGLARRVGRSQIVDREDDLRGVPVPPVQGTAQQRLAGSDVFADRVAQIFDVKPAVPVDDHGAWL